MLKDFYLLANEKNVSLRGLVAREDSASSLDYEGTIRPKNWNVASVLRTGRGRGRYANFG